MANNNQPSSSTTTTTMTAPNGIGYKTYSRRNQLQSLSVSNNSQSLHSHSISDPYNSSSPSPSPASASASASLSPSTSTTNNALVKDRPISWDLSRSRSLTQNSNNVHHHQSSNLNLHSTQSKSLSNSPSRSPSFPLPLQKPLPSSSSSSSSSSTTTTTSSTSALRNLGSAQKSHPGSHQTPFRPGFQPRGVYRDRTTELLNFRNSKQESKRLQESRLQKRLEKLIDLHFPPTNPALFTRGKGTGNDRVTKDVTDDESRNSSIIGTGMIMSQKLLGIVKGSPTPARDQSSIGLDPPKPSPLSMAMTATKNSNSVRTQEQRIVRWQEDKEVERCRLCKVQFSLRVRKHHCRLCGSVICFAPTSVNQKASRCSTLIRFEWNDELERSYDYEEFESRKIRGEFEKEERLLNGIVVELSEEEMGIQDNRPQSVFEMISSSSSSSKGNVSELEKQQRNRSSTSFISNNQSSKGFRVCRECLSIVLRRQSMIHPPIRPDYLNLYKILKDLNEDVERILPEFKELIFTSKNPSSNLNPMKSNLNLTTVSTTKLINLRKRLLTNLTLYDSTSKRISNLISTSASLNLSKNKNKGSVKGAGGGGYLNESEIRLLRSINIRSINFLREKMSLIRSIGSIEFNSLNRSPSSSSSSNKQNKSNKKKKNSRLSNRSNKIDDNNGNGEKEEEEEEEEEDGDYDENYKKKKVVEMAVGRGSNSKDELIKLNVLLEQERLVESYLEQALGLRKFDDANSLKISLDDLREEISQLKESLQKV